jgi:hypothetical protein
MKEVKYYVSNNRWQMVMVLSFIICHLSFCHAVAQQYTGMAGLIHVPSADMDSAGVARIGLHYVDKEMIPDGMKLDKEKFNSLTNYLSITPFRWIEVGYGYTLWKLHKNHDKNLHTGFYAKDRYLSLRLQLLYEGSYWPSVVVGGTDVWGSGDDGLSGSNYYRNFYVAATKHLEVGYGTLGTHLAYRKWKRDYNHKWNGVVGGLTFQPSFYPPLRFIGEWDGTEVNVGADCTIYKYFLLQASLQRFRHFSGGLCFRLNLL